MKIKLIWKKLILEKKRYATKDDLIPLCGQIGKDPQTVVHYLSTHGYIHRVFNGFYYVMSPNEIEGGAIKKSTFELVADGLKFKGIKKWYFGLETALKMNNLTHEYFSVNYIVSDSYRTTKVVKIIDAEFQFLKWSKKMSDFGIVKKNKLKYSDPEKTVLDMVYRNYWKKIGEKQMLSPLIEYEERLNSDRLSKYLKNYPKKMKIMVEGYL